MTVLYTKLSFLCIYEIYVLVLCATVHGTQITAVPEIEMNPSSLLVSIGTTALFECKVRHCPQTCSVNWIINGSSTAHNHQQNQYEKQGFAFSHQRNATTNVYTGRLAISASIGINNTELCCLVQDGINPSRKSDQATLLVISEPPLIPNPSIKIQNSTFLLEWSPPFLWPGQHIDYFIIKVVILNDGSIAHYLVNTTFDDTIIPLTVELDTYDLRVCTCTEFLFRISAIGPGQVELPSFNVTGRFLSSCSVLEFAVAGINTSVLFTNKIIPILEINIKLPSLVCAHQTVNYSITIIDKTVNQSNNSMNYMYTSYYYGPYFHTGAGIVRQHITSGLMRDKEYSVIGNIGIESKTIQSNEVLLSTVFEVSEVFTHCTELSNDGGSVFYYKLSMGLCLTVVVFIQLILTAMAILKCTHYQRRKCNESRTSRVCNHADAYDCPEYESVKSPINKRFDILTAAGVPEAIATTTFTRAANQ